MINGKDLLHRTEQGSASSWKGTKAQGAWRGKGAELRKIMCVQECFRDGQGGCFGRVEGAGAQTARPGLQRPGSRREHLHEMQPLQLFLPTSALFSSSSQNSHLLGQASCQDVAIETFTPDPGCDSCSTTMLGKSTPLPPTSGRKHNPDCTENNKLWLISPSETLQYDPLCDSPASCYQEGINIYLDPQQQASRR